MVDGTAAADGDDGVLGKIVDDTVSQPDNPRDSNPVTAASVQRNFLLRTVMWSILDQRAGYDCANSDAVTHKLQRKES